ncbi:MAG: hypothetical protein Q9181_004210 [Wetmoreana brouardii]
MSTKSVYVIVSTRLDFETDKEDKHKGGSAPTTSFTESSHIGAPTIARYEVSRQYVIEQVCTHANRAYENAQSLLDNWVMDNLGGKTASGRDPDEEGYRWYVGVSGDRLQRLEIEVWREELNEMASPLGQEFT